METSTEDETDSIGCQMDVTVRVKSEDNCDNNTEKSANNDANEESVGNEDILSSMSGRDQEIDEESETGDKFNSVLNNGLMAENVNKNENKGESDSVSSSKRKSEESDLSQTKRIKSEPTEKVSEKSTRLTTTIEAVEDEEPPPPEIPINSYEFMSYLLDLNANHLESNESNKFSMSRNLQDIRQTLRFNDFDNFRNAFIPYILTDLWRKLNYHYNRKHTNLKKSVMSLKYFLSILTKIKSNKMKNGLEMKCISVVRPKEGPVFQFGQLITIQTAVQPKPNSSTHIITKRKYFAYITSHSIRGTNAENQSEVNHLRLLNESKKDCVVVEEITFMIKYSDELYLRNDALIVAEPIVCVHNYHMEARSVFKFHDFPIWKQIFDPIFSTKPSGLTVTVNEKRYGPEEVEMIQVALDVVANGSFSNSCFFAINSSKEPNNKSLILIEIIRQIVLCKAFENTKVLFTSSNQNTLQNVDQILNSKKIRTFFIESNVENSLFIKEKVTKFIENILAKDLEPQQKERYEQCLQYFESGHHLSVDCLVLKNSILDKIRNDLLITSSVIVGQIPDLCNDILFYKYFSQPNHCITCCIIDDSASISEPQLYSLLWFGITKFLLAGDNNLCKDDGSDICRTYGLSRSFFHRYYSLYLETNTTNQSTVFNI